VIRLSPSYKCFNVLVPFFFFLFLYNSFVTHLRSSAFNECVRAKFHPLLCVIFFGVLPSFFLREIRVLFFEGIPKRISLFTSRK